MIRPLTIVSCLLAFGSGLYLYQSKHEVQLLDRTIERTVRETSGVRDQSRLLAAEWTMLNDFDRLRQFSDTYLNLKPIAPAQFTSVADLVNRLPAPRTEVPARGTDEQEALSDVAEAAPRPVAEPAQVVVADEVLPTPPIPTHFPAPVVASVARTPDVKSAEVKSVDRRPNVGSVGGPSAAAVVADSQPHPAAPPPRPIVLATPRPSPATAPINLPAHVAVAAPLAPVPSRPAMVATAGIGAARAYGAPYGGSLLGMARGSMPAAPRPTPVSASYNTN